MRRGFCKQAANERQRRRGKIRPGRWKGKGRLYGMEPAPRVLYLGEFYSDRSSSSGSIPAARRAARNDVSSAAVATTSATPPNVMGSRGLTP